MALEKVGHCVADTPTHPILATLTGHEDHAICRCMIFVVGLHLGAIVKALPKY